MAAAALGLLACALLALPLLAMLPWVRSALHGLRSAVRRLWPRSARSSAAAPVSSSARRVLVVGGSFGGLTFCSELLHALRRSGVVDVAVVLVEPREWFEYTPGVLRAVVRPAHHAALLTNIRDTAAGRDGRLSHVRAVCKALTANAALLSRGGATADEWLPFDFCVLATGSGYSEHIKQRDIVTADQRDIIAPHSAGEALKDAPVLAPPCCPAEAADFQSPPAAMCPFPSSAPTIAQRLQALRSVHGALQASHEVRVVGAGLVGVELAAEVAESLPSKRCTLHCKGAAVLEGLPAAAQRKAAEWLRARGVHIDYHSSRSAEEIRRSCGPSAFVFDCCGVLPAPSPAAVSAAGSGGGWQRDSCGRYLVNSAQQLSTPGAAHLYAIGDCCAGPVHAAQLAYTAELQAAVAAGNVARQLQRGVHTGGLLAFPLSLSRVLPAPSLVCCSLGARDGVLVFNDIAVGGWLAALTKHVIERSKVGQYRGELASVLLWAVGEPMTFLLNRVYHAVARSWQSVQQRVNHRQAAVS